MSKFKSFILDERMYFAICDECDSDTEPQSFSSDVEGELERSGWDVVNGKLTCKWCLSGEKKKLLDAAKEFFASQK